MAPQLACSFVGTKMSLFDINHISFLFLGSFYLITKLFYDKKQRGLFGPSEG